MGLLHLIPSPTSKEWTGSRPEDPTAHFFHTVAHYHQSKHVGTVVHAKQIEMGRLRLGVLVPAALG
jgi:hypothetical protein